MCTERIFTLKTLITAGPLTDSRSTHYDDPRILAFNLTSSWSSEHYYLYNCRLVVVHVYNCTLTLPEICPLLSCIMMILEHRLSIQDRRRTQNTTMNIVLDKLWYKIAHFYYRRFPPCGYANTPLFPVKVCLNHIDLFIMYNYL